MKRFGLKHLIFLAVITLALGGCNAREHRVMKLIDQAASSLASGHYQEYLKKYDYDYVEAEKWVKPFTSDDSKGWLINFKHDDAKLLLQALQKAKAMTPTMYSSNVENNIAKFKMKHAIIVVNSFENHWLILYDINR